MKVLEEEREMKKVLRKKRLEKRHKISNIVKTTIDPGSVEFERQLKRLATKGGK
jgi:CRISPR/Cas system-associated exonuclease Cas4 (RecB family)